jgi:hypothetical protein
VDADPPSWIRLVAAQGSSVPEVASSAPRPDAGDPFRLRNIPPTITRLPSGVRTIALTLSSAVGAQPSSEPSAALKAARWLRATPLAVEKFPPTYTVVLVAVIALTVASRFGAKLDIS